MKTICTLLFTCIFAYGVAKDRIVCVMEEPNSYRVVPTDDGFRLEFFNHEDTDVSVLYNYTVESEGQEVCRIYPRFVYIPAHSNVTRHRTCDSETKSETIVSIQFLALTVEGTLPCAGVLQIAMTCSMNKASNVTVSILPGSLPNDLISYLQTLGLSDMVQQRSSQLKWDVSEASEASKHAKWIRDLVRTTQMERLTETLEKFYMSMKFYNEGGLFALERLHRLQEVMNEMLARWEEIERVHAFIHDFYEGPH